MKKFFALMASAVISAGAFAQLPNGSVAPDFTATDINGVEHNLYSLLDQGYKVILDFSATWCGPCWSYHEAGTLSELYNTYGPDGTDEIRVFYLEADDTTTDADLNGTGTATQGDWVTGTPYTIIDNAGSIFDDYAGAYYPTIYTVCPSRIITESGQASVADHAAIFQANSCAAASLPNDGALVGYAGETVACGDAPISLAVTLMNMGVDPLTSCTITAYDGATAVGSTDWMGNLDTYATEEVLVTTTTIDASTEFTFEITSMDDNAENNSVASGLVNTSVESTNNVRFTLNLDAYPGETAWAVLDDMGNVVEAGGPYAAGDVGAGFVFDWTLDLGCYTFVIQDAYGDGLHASWYNGTGPDGNFSLDAMDGSAVSTNLLSYSSPDEYAVIEFPFEVTSVSDVEEASLIETLAMFPNPTQGVSNIQFTSAVAANATMEVFNLVGERVAVQAFGTLPAGAHRLELNLEAVKAGVYLVNLNAGGETTTMRVTKH